MQCCKEEKTSLLHFLLKTVTKPHGLEMQWWFLMSSPKKSFFPTTNQRTLRWVSEIKVVFGLLHGRLHGCRWGCNTQSGFWKTNEFLWFQNRHGEEGGCPQCDKSLCSLLSCVDGSTAWRIISVKPVPASAASPCPKQSRKAEFIPGQQGQKAQLFTQLIALTGWAVTSFKHKQKQSTHTHKYSLTPPS